MNMEFKAAASRQETSDMEKVILMTAHQMQADGNVCKRYSVISGLKVKLRVQQQQEENDFLQNDVIIRRLEMQLIAQRQSGRDAKLKYASITQESSPRRK
jgi:archaellum biogenesis ATPase FlaH